MDLGRFFSNGIINGIYLALIFFIFINRKHLGKYVNLVLAAIVITFISEFCSFVKFHYFDNGNNIIYMVVGVIGIVFTLYLLYFYKLVENKFSKKIQLLLLILHIFNFIISAIVVEDFFSIFPFVTNYISVFLILISVGVFLQDTFNSDKVLSLKNYYPFFVAVSLTIIYVGLVPVLYFTNKVTLLPSEALIFRNLLVIINIVGYSLMLSGIFISKSNKKL